SKGYAYPVLCGNFGSERYAYIILCGNFRSEAYAYPVLCGSLDQRASLLDITRFKRGACRGTEGGRVVEESEKEANSDLLSDAHSRPRLAESGDSCESKVKPE
nr:hypothetical protein [Tanacetum cinerariifolium]